MTHSDIWNKLPQGWPVTSISSRITNIEELARETTAKMVVETLVNEGENALTQHNDPETLLAMLGQATTYLQTIEDRSPKYLEPSEESLETHFQKLDDQPFETLERAVLRHEAVLGTITEDPNGNDPESPVRQRTLDAFMLALSLALSAHVSALSKKTLLRDGHRQTTQGLFMNLETLAPEQVTLAPSVAEQRDTALRLRTKTAVDTATRQLMLKIPVITQLTPVEFHPSLDHDPKAHQQAKSIADETISNVENAHLTLQGASDPSPTDSIHCFFHAGRLHIKRLNDEYPKGFSQEQALNIINHLTMQVYEHREYHDPDWGQALITTLSEQRQDAWNDNHTASTKSIDLMLKAVHEATGHPALIRAAAEQMLGYGDIADRHLERRQDISRTASPEQAQAIMTSARYQGLTPGQLDHLERFLNAHSNEDLIPEDSVSHSAALRILEAAKEVNSSLSRLGSLAADLGNWSHDDPVTAWMYDNADADFDIDEDNDED